MAEVGDKAPDFTLPATTGEARLSALYAGGNVVLAFYTEDSTTLCSSEVAMLRDDYEIIRKLGAEVLAVSADTLESHADFARRIGGLPFPLASDTGLEAARAYGVVDDAGKRSRRAVFVIDTGGLIIHAERWFQPGNPAQFEAIFRALGFEG
ncbi:MAG TPA: peroxiredoxin family protein [Dehalococcoidia bacterium]|nr:peroxiredoxin family protein [Dehalococcoidia bacterium]